MKHSEMLNLNLPEDNDLINVGHISGNFEKIDSAFQTLPVKQEESKTDIDVMACPPYWTMYNPTDEDIVYIDHNFFDEEFTLEAGQTIVHEIEEPENIRISSEVTIDYIWFIPASEAFSGGGGGGTSDYNKLNNLPTINNVEIKNNKTADDLGLVAKEKDKGLSTNDFTNDYKEQLDGLDSALASKLDGGSVGVAGGVASLGNDGKVPSSQLPTPTVQKEYKLVEASAEGYAKSYKLQQKNGETWSDISASASINIPKDMVVESGSVKECTTDNVPVSGYKKGDKYIDLVIANKADAHIYINVKDLVDNKAEGIQYINTTSKLTATNVQSAIDEIAALAKGNESAISDINEALDNKVDETELSSAINDVKTNILSTVVASSNATASNAKTIEFQGTGKNLEKLVIEGKTSQDGTPSPSAPVEVKGVGDLANIFNVNALIRKDGYFTNDSGVETASSDGSSGYTVNYISVKPSTKYTIIGTITNSNLLRVYYYDSNKNWISRTAGTATPYAFTTPSNCKYIRFQYAVAVIKPDTIQIAEGDTQTFHPYGTYKIPISCGGATKNVYLDAPLFNTEKADVVSGVVEKKYLIKVLDGSENWSIASSGMDFYASGIAPELSSLPKADTFGYCNKYKVIPNNVDWRAYENAISNSQGAIYLKDSRYEATTEGLEQFKSNLSTNPLVIIYKINSTKETFEAPEIATTVGKNTLSVDTEVTPAKLEATSFGEYYSKAEVDKMLAEKVNTSDMIVIRGSVSYDDTLVLNVPTGTYDLTLMQGDSASVRYIPNKYILRIATTDGVATTYFYAISEPTPSRKIESVSIDSNYNVTFKFNTKAAVFTLALHKV